MNSVVRIMTYNIHGCRGRGSALDPERVLQTIATGAPDIVALQQVADGEQLQYLAERLGMQTYGKPACGGNAFLSYLPLRGVSAYDLGHGGSTCHANADVAGKRLQIYNVCLASQPLSRGRQVANLFEPDLLGNRRLDCPTLVLGDFADWWWGRGNLSLSILLRSSRLPFWNATYPARCPLFGRDRAYTRGGLRVIDSRILRSRQARLASTHLPLVLSVQICDPRTFLRTEKMDTGRMEIAPG